jgi:hypothetical protein
VGKKSVRMLYAFVQFLANVCTDRPKTSAQRQVIPYKRLSE